MRLSEHVVDELKDVAHIFSLPCLRKMSSLCVENFAVKGDANTLEHSQRHEAAGATLSTEGDNVADRRGPSCITRVDG